ncbi:unnamed protein product, partial [Didymodactylos carnosus]
QTNVSIRSKQNSTRRTATLSAPITTPEILTTSRKRKSTEKMKEYKAGGKKLKLTD